MTAPVPLVERLAEVFREFWASDADDRDAEFIRTAPESVETSLEYARALLPVVEQAVAEGRAAALREAAKEAEERGDIGKDGGIEAWEWLRIRAGRIAVPVAADRDECPGDHAGPCFEGRPELCRDILRGAL